MEQRYSLMGDDEHIDSLAAKRIITASRRWLKNPYAHLDDTGAYSALSAATVVISIPTDKVRESRKLLQDPYAYLDDSGGITAAPETTVLQAMAPTAIDSELRYSSLRKRVKTSSRNHYSFAEIERKAVNLQKLLWKDRAQIWPESAISDPIDILDPSIAFKLMGFSYDISETLGQYFDGGRKIEVAGLIDDAESQVWISRRFPSEVQRYTAAHELGHALLHSAQGLHRDRPRDGSSITRDKLELEADKFASYFLMPEKLVRARFERVFLTHQFCLNEDTTFALAGENSLEVTTTRGLSRILASAENYGGIRFRPLSNQFGVSVETMAIRIEELGLLAY